MPIRQNSYSASGFGASWVGINGGQRTKQHWAVKTELRSDWLNDSDEFLKH